MNKLIDSVSLSLLNIGQANLDKRWNYENVFSPFFRIYYITDGEAKVYHHNTMYELKPHHMYLIPSFTYSHYSCDKQMSQYYISALEVSESGFSIFSNSVFFYEVEATKMDLFYFERLLEINPNRTIVNDNPKVYDNKEGIEQFVNENERLSKKNYIETKGLLMCILSKFLREDKVTKNVKDKTFKLIVNYIDEHLHADITVKQLADDNCMSVDHFSRQFKSVFSVRPSEYIQTKRIERAQLLLVASSYNLQQIADKIGFSSVSYFARVFKAKTLKTPLQYRKEIWTI